MNGTLHITSGDIAGGSLAKSGLSGEVFVWHDILYEGPRNPGLPDEETLNARALFLERTTDGGLSRELVLDTLKNQYRKIAEAGDHERVVLWFDACLFDQSMLVHVLMCLRQHGVHGVQLLCVDAFPGIEPFNGLGQLLPEQLAALYDQRSNVTEEQFLFAQEVDKAFALQDKEAFVELARQKDAPLPWVPAAVARWLQEQPDAKTGLGRLEQLALDAVRAGYTTPSEIFKRASEMDTHPQFWGDTTLWVKINALAARQPPLIRVEGPASRLPQWESPFDLNEFRIVPLPV